MVSALCLQVKLMDGGQADQVVQQMGCTSDTKKHQSP